VAYAYIDADDPRLMDTSAAEHAVENGGARRGLLGSAPDDAGASLDAVWPTGTCARAARLALDRDIPQRERTAYLAPLAGHSRGRHLVPAHAVPGGLGAPPLPQHQHDLPLPRTQSLLTAPYIPASAVAERFALFRLSERWDRWHMHLRVTAKATFVRRRARHLVVTLTQPA
jgi:hypothetical protein